MAKINTRSWVGAWGTISFPRAVGLGAVLLLFAIMTGVLAAPVFAGDPPTVENEMCPVTTDEPVDPNYWVTYQGRTIGFCCRKCKTKFLSDPGSYVVNLPPVDPKKPEEDSSDHEHSTDHGAPGDRPRLLVIVGRLHVMAVHFPVVLLMLAALFELAGLRDRWRVAADAVRPFIGLGVIASIGAAGLGLIHGLDADYRGDLLGYFEWHRALGLATVAGSILAWFLIERRRRDPTRANIRAARIVIVLLGMLVGVAGHLGGALVFGPNFLIP